MTWREQRIRERLCKEAYHRAADAVTEAEVVLRDWLPPLAVDLADCLDRYSLDEASPVLAIADDLLREWDETIGYSPVIAPDKRPDIGEARRVIERSAESLRRYLDDELPALDVREWD